MNILKRPMFFAAVVCCLAAAISLFSKTAAILIIAAAVILLVFAVLNKKYQYITVLFLIVLFVVSLIFQFVKIAKLSATDGKKVSGSFVVVEEATDHDTFKELDCSLLPNGTKLLVFDYEKEKLKTGDIVDATLVLSFVDQYDKYRFLNYGDEIYVTANAQELIITSHTNWFYKVAGDIRDFVKQIVLSRFDGDVAGLLVALTIGDKTLLSDDFLDNVKTTGISHVIVVSGMHLSIIMMAVYFCIDRLFYNKYIRSILSIAFVVLIYSVCGFTMSITRAGAMFIIAGLAPVFSRDNDSLSSLLTAITVVLISSPFAIFNISFQLSALSTLAIIWVVPFYYSIITERLNISSKFLKTMLSTALCSVFAMLFTLPIIIKTFGYVSVVAPVTNLIINPFITLELVSNIAALATTTLPIVNILSYPLFWISALCSHITVFTVNILANLPITVAVLPKSAFWWSILILAFIIGYMYYFEYKLKRSDFYANSI